MVSCTGLKHSQEQFLECTKPFNIYLFCLYFQTSLKEIKPFKNFQMFIKLFKPNIKNNDIC